MPAEELTWVEIPITTMRPADRQESTSSEGLKAVVGMEDGGEGRERERELT